LATEGREGAVDLEITDFRTGAVEDDYD
jgi:hypothetical protein